MPFWTDRYIAACHHLSDAEHGRYLLIIMELWRAHGQRIPNDVAWLARKFGRSAQAVENELIPIMREFCTCDGNWWRQKTVSEQWEYVSKRVLARRDSANKRWGKDKSTSERNAGSHDVRNATTTTTTTNKEIDISLGSVGSRKDETNPRARRTNPRSVETNPRTKNYLNGHLADFELWYAAYPRKVARGAAERAFARAITITTLQELTSGAERYAKSVAGKEPQYVKHPATWLNGKCWLDSDGVSKPRGPKAPPPTYLIEQAERANRERPDD